jgi:putative two-component system response regulator
MDVEIKSGKILIVDDEPKNVELLEKALFRNGYQNFKSTTDPREVLSIYKEYSPDLLLLDLVMPQLDGFAVMEQLKPLTQDYFPILILTALNDDSTCLKALDNGGKDFMIKPFSLIEMLSRVKNLLEIQLLHKRVRNQNLILEQIVQERTQELKSTRLSIIQRLSLAAEFRDHETGNHIIRMSNYSALLARKVGFDDQRCELILNAAPMHDIGKIGIPDSILLKPGKLDNDEWQIMKTHVDIGAKILSNDHSKLILLARQIALQHHEKFDGSGYPNGLKNEEILAEVRIITVCDMFDALTSKRPYKEAWSVEAAITELENKSGSALDPKLIIAFKEILPSILEVRAKHLDDKQLNYI